MTTLRGRLIAWAKKEYGGGPERPFSTAPAYEVLRHAENRKWYALFMDVPYSRLGLPGEGRADVVDLKCDPVLAAGLRDGAGILPGYHMRRESWITVLLDGTVPLKDIKPLLSLSFDFTSAKRAGAKSSRITRWLVPANPKFYDIEEGLRESGDGTILWKQSSGVHVGDTVYIYVAAPVSAVRYKCGALETDIPMEYRDENVSMKRVMRLKLLRRYDGAPIGRELLQKHGVFAVRGPRSMPRSLETEIEEMYRA